MGRYCIVCKKFFGCVKEEVKHVCSDCRLLDGCNILHDLNLLQITGGICGNCWENRQTLKKIVNY